MVKYNAVFFAVNMSGSGLFVKRCLGVLCQCLARGQEG